MLDLTDSDMTILILVLTEVWTMFTDYHRVKQENGKQSRLQHNSSDETRTLLFVANFVVWRVF